MVEKPFKVVGRSVALDEQETIGLFRRMQQHDLISRIGAVVHPNTVGASTLAAMVPPDRLEEVAGIASREPLVTHNYEREHDLNLWFVVASSDADAVERTIASIEQQTHLAVIRLPMLRAYHLGLGFPLGVPWRQRNGNASLAGDYRPIHMTGLSLRRSRTGCRWSSIPISRWPIGLRSIRPG